MAIPHEITVHLPDGFDGNSTACGVILLEDDEIIVETLDDDPPVNCPLCRESEDE